MPKYSFCCTNCNKSFELNIPIKEYDRSLKRCVYCSSKNVYRDYINDEVGITYRLAESEIKTLGHLAHRHSEKFSKDQKRHLQRKNNEYRRGSKKDLPRGMKRVSRRNYPD